MININEFKWTREPLKYEIDNNTINVTTKPHTDLWQRTYYHFRNDNAPVLQIKSNKQFFTFVVKCEFNYKNRFDQCGVCMYLDSDNWLKASIEFENEEFSHLGSVVTNNGYSDWATQEISSDIKAIYYRLSRREDDFCIECSLDGKRYQQLRVCHMFNSKEEVSFGIYACSPEESSFEAIFKEIDLIDCVWLKHDGQQPD